MYIMPTMIDMGLEEGQEWPSEAHKVVASHIGLCNPCVVNRDSLTEIVQAVLKIPQDEIQQVDLITCASKYHVPFISLS